MNRSAPLIFPLFVALALLTSGPAAAQTSPTASPVRQLSLENEPWKGDFDAMLERRIIRVLVPYSRTLYFVDKGRERGLTADLARDFEQYLNTKVRQAAGQASVDGDADPDDARPAAVRRRGRTGRHRRRQPDGDGRAATNRRFRRAERIRSRCGSCSSPGPARRRSRRSRICPARPCTCGRRRATSEQRARAESALDRRGQASGPGGRSAGSARGRGCARDAECGAHRRDRGGRLEGPDVGTGPAEDPGSAGSGAAHGRLPRLGGAQEQSPASHGDGGLLQVRHGG